METIVIHVPDIMNSADPVSSLSRLFGLELSKLEELRMALQTRQELLLAEVVQWKGSWKGWEQIADMLEGVQQHSNYFYLIWGTADDLTNTKALSAANELENLPDSNAVSEV